MLNPIAPDLWSIDYKVDMGPMWLPARTFVLRLPGGVMLISPGPLTEADRAAIAELGPVTALVAPNLFHHLYLPAALDAFPEASVFAPPGLAKKNRKLASLVGPSGSPGPSGKELRDIGELSQSPLEGLQALPIAGMPTIQETVFYHGSSQTLLLTDLAFNIEQPKGLGMFVVFHIFGTYKRFKQSRLVGLATKDRAAAKRSMEALLELDFERVLVAHGNPVVESAKERLREALGLS